MSMLTESHVLPVAALSAGLAGLVVLGLAARGARIDPRTRFVLLLVALAVHPLSAILPRVGLSIPVPMAASAVPADTDGVRSPLAAAPPVGSPAGSTTRPARSEPTSGAPAALLTILWGAVAGGLLLRWSASIVATGSLVRRSERDGEPRAWAGLARLSADPRVAGTALHYSAEAGVPFAWGLLRPTIVLPGSARSWPAARLAMVLKHELAHLRRADVLWLNLGRVICALFWFSPVVWLLQRRLEDAAEACCDAEVLAAGHRPSAYVDELLAVMRSLRSPRLSAGVPFGADGRVERRVAAILAPPARRPRFRHAVATAGFVALALALVRPVAATDGTLVEASDDAGALAAWTGCLDDGGRHVNRWYETADGMRWQVAWDGADCSVDFEANEAGARAIRGLSLVDPEPGGWLTVRVRGPRPVDLRLSAEDVSSGRTAERETRSRMEGFLPELERHTGYAAAPRVAAALGAGGVPAVLRLASRARGDHAAGVYLLELLHTTALEPDQVRGVLRVASDRVENDAVMQALLVDVLQRYSMEDADGRAAWAAAASRLRSRAAIEATNLAARATWSSTAPAARY